MGARGYRKINGQWTEGFGRQTRTLDASERVLDELRDHGILTLAARNAGVSSDAVRKWREADPVYDEACQDAIDEVLDRIELKLLQLAEKGNFPAVKMMLTLRRPETWAPNNAGKAPPKEREREQRQHDRYLPQDPLRIVDVSGTVD